MRSRRIVVLLLIFFVILEAQGFSNFREFQKNLSTKTSLQGGVEYDTNVYKTLDTTGLEDDFLVRIFASLAIDYKLTTKDSLFFTYQAGAKKFIDIDDKDTLMNSLKLGYRGIFLDKNIVVVEGNVKTKDERGSDPALKEDYFLTWGAFRWGRNIRDFADALFDVQYSYFDFDANNNFDYVRGRYGVTFDKRFLRFYTGNLGYHFSHQDFRETLIGFGDRSDTKHEFLTAFEIDRFILSRFSYVFEDSNSNISGLSFTNHRFSLQVSRNFPWDTTLVAQGTFQIKSYPRSEFVDEEGQRFLLTEAEEENFNSIIVKASKKISEDLFLEFKFSRFSNELSDKEDSFRRYLYNLSVRYVF